jgi:hypothetical protein
MTSFADIFAILSSFKRFDFTIYFHCTSDVSCLTDGSRYPCQSLYVTFPVQNTVWYKKAKKVFRTHTCLEV